MIRQIVAVTCAVGIWVATLSADLKYTMTVTARPSSVPSAQPPNPILSMLGALVVGTIAPAGGVQTTAIVGERGSRFEYDKAYTIVPAGGAMIVTPDGAIVVLNMVEKTYWRMARPDGPLAMPGTPAVKVDRTGTFDTIAGVRAERASIEIRVALPVPTGAAMPGLPSDLTVNGEAWLADQFKKYATMSASFSAMVGSLGPDTLSSAGFPMRSIMRSDLFGGQEIESVVTSIGEVPTPVGAFDVPPGFTEVPPPRLGLPPMGPVR